MTIIISIPEVRFIGIKPSAFSGIQSRGVHDRGSKIKVLKQVNKVKGSQIPFRRTQVAKIETLGSIEVIKKLVPYLFYGGKC